MGEANKMFNKIISGGHQYKIGMYFGIGLVLLSLASKLKTPLFEFQSPFDWLLVFISGLAVFFFFMGIAFNTDTNTRINENADEKGRINRNKQEEIIIYLKQFNILTKSCFWVSGILAFLFLIRFFIILLN